MKASITRSALVLVFFLSMLSCETIVEFKGEHQEPLPVLNAVVVPDEPVKVFYSSSVFILDDAYSDTHIAGANVELYINGEFVEELKAASDSNQWNGNERHYYISSHCPNNNDQVRIQARSSQFPEWAGATVTIPADLSVDNLQITQTNLDEDGYLHGKAQVSLSDALGEKNYYWVLGHTLCRESEEEDFTAHAYRYLFDYTDIAFSEGKLEGVMDEILATSGGGRYAIFDDTLLEGKDDYPLTMDWSLYEYYTQYDALFEVQCYQTDEHLYKYLRSLALAGNNSLFSEPVQIYSNVEGGIGIVGARSRTKSLQCLYSEINK